MANTEIRLIIFFPPKDGEALYSQQKQPTGSWLWLRSWTPYSQFRLKLKKVGKTTRPFRYDLKQIPYDYTEEVRNRFKGLDMIECLKNYGQRFMTLYRRQWSRASPRKKKYKKAKWLSKEALQTAEKRRETKGKGEKERITHLNTEFQRIARTDKKAFLIDECKEIEENNGMGKTRDLKKMRDTNGTFHAKMGIIIVSVQFSHSVMSDSATHGYGLWQHIRLPCPSPTPGVYSNSSPLSQWCHPIISSSVAPFSSCLQSFPSSGSFPMSQFFTSGGQILDFEFLHRSFQWTVRIHFL